MESQVSQLKELFNGGGNAEKCYEMAQRIRAQMLLQPSGQNNQNTQLLCQVLEISALLTLNLEQLVQFDLLSAQLQAIYFSSQENFEGSTSAPLLVGLMLMRLLTDNRIAEFHLLLERIQNWNFVYSNPFISFPVTLEQSLMEGSFRNVLQSVSNAPSPYFSPFTRIIAHAVRETIASSCESSFQSVTLEELAKLLFFSSLEEVSQFVRSRNWTLSSDQTRVVFGSLAASDRHEASAYCTQMLLANLGLAREMESII